MGNIYIDDRERHIVLFKVIESYREDYEGYETGFYTVNKIVVNDLGVQKSRNKMFSSFFEGAEDEHKNRHIFLNVNNLPKDDKINIVKRIFQW